MPGNWGILNLEFALSRQSKKFREVQGALHEFCRKKEAKIVACRTRRGKATGRQIVVFEIRSLKDLDTLIDAFLWGKGLVPYLRTVLPHQDCLATPLEKARIGAESKEMLDLFLEVGNEIRRRRDAVQGADSDKN